MNDIDNKYAHLFNEVFSSGKADATVENIRILLHYLNKNGIDYLPGLSTEYKVFQRTYNGYPATYITLDEPILMEDGYTNKFRVGDFEGRLFTYYPL